MTVIYEDDDDGELDVRGSDSFLVKKKLNDTQKYERSLVNSDELSIEDKWEDEYFDITGKTDSQVIRPRYEPLRLATLASNNNTLGQCVSAMEVNIDGTGYDIETLIDEDDPSESTLKEVKGLKDFFDEVYPKESFLMIRRALRIDQELVGNAYLEIMRSISGDIVFLHRLESVLVRMLRLDDPVPVKVEVDRFGKKQTVVMMKRERRFVQKVGKKNLYFKEYAASRQLDKTTGLWETPEKPVPVENRASEVLHFYPLRDTVTPYGVPRWVSQAPSVLGSRKAEELNLDFFDSGGLPPALMVVQGGMLTEPVKKQLDMYLSGKEASKNRAAVVEVQSASTSLDGTGTVKVDVHKFGNDMTKDSMFEEYLDKCESRVRISFRLPPLFIGKADDYTYASAYASYTVAEAQVFKPERLEFDNLINRTIMKELNPKYKLVSKGLYINDTTVQLKGIELASKRLTKGVLINTINTIAGLSMKVPEGTSDELVEDLEKEFEMKTQLAQTRGFDGENNPTKQAPREPTKISPVKNKTPKGKNIQTTPGGNPSKNRVKADLAIRKMDQLELIGMADDYVDYTLYNKGTIDTLMPIVKSLTGGQKELFEAYTSIKIMQGLESDPEGTFDLMDGANSIISCDSECNVEV